MPEYATKDDVQEIVNKAVDDLSEVIGNLIQAMHGELTEIRADIKDIRKTLKSGTFKLIQS